MGIFTHNGMHTFPEYILMGTSNLFVLLISLQFFII